MGEHSYDLTIHVKEETSVENNSGIAGNYGDDPHSEEVQRRLKNTSKNKSDSGDNAENIKTLAGVAIVAGTAKKVVSNAITQEISSISQRTGQNEYGAKVNEVYTTATSTVTEAGGVVASFAIHPILGALTLGATLISKLISLENKLGQQRQNINSESITQNIATVRSGNINTRRTS